MKRRNYSIRNFSQLSEQQLYKASLRDLDEYISQIEKRQRFLGQEFLTKSLGLEFARAQTKNGKRKNMAETIGVLAGSGFYLYDPTGASTMAFFGFAIPIVIVNKVLDRKPSKKAKAIILDIIALEREVSVLEDFHAQATNIRTRRKKTPI